MELTDIRRLGLPGFLNLRLAKVSKFMKVCSLHFKLEAEIFSKYLSITGWHTVTLFDHIYTSCKMYNINGIISTKLFVLFFV